MLATASTRVKSKTNFTNINVSTLPNNVNNSFELDSSIMKLVTRYFQN